MDSEKYIGLDVHQATISVAVLDSTGKLVMVAKSFANFRTLTPCFRNDRIRSNSPELKCRSAGRPIRFPARRACAIPAFTLSRRSSRSNSATAPRIENVSLPAGSVVSMFCRRETRSEEHTSELQSLRHLVCRLLLEKKKTNNYPIMLQEMSRSHHVSPLLSRHC